MDMTGSRRIEAPRAKVWDALNDPEVLKAAIPGCESVERTAPDAFAAKVSIRIGPMSAKFAGKVNLTNIRAPEGYTISGEGSGGAMGFARGGADVALAEEGPNVTLLTYDVKAQVGGKIAQLGARLVDSTAKSMADQFFDRFAAQVATPAAVPAAPAAPEPEPVPVATQPQAVVVGRAGPATQTATQMRAEPVGGRYAHLLNRIPREPLGLPIAFWIGSGVMVVILALLFVVG